MKRLPLPAQILLALIACFHCVLQARYPVFVSEAVNSSPFLTSVFGYSYTIVRVVLLLPFALFDAFFGDGTPFAVQKAAERLALWCFTLLALTSFAGSIVRKIRPELPPPASESHDFAP